MYNINIVNNTKNYYTIYNKTKTIINKYIINRLYKYHHGWN